MGWSPCGGRRLFRCLVLSGCRPFFRGGLFWWFLFPDLFVIRSSGFFPPNRTCLPPFLPWLGGWCPVSGHPPPLPLPVAVVGWSCGPILGLDVSACRKGSIRGPCFKCHRNFGDFNLDRNRQETKKVPDDNSSVRDVKKRVRAVFTAVFLGVLSGYMYRSP